MLDGRDAIIFDGDDTLWHTQVLYERAKCEFYALMAANGLGDAELGQRLARVDVANVATMGFSPERFAASMVEVYRHLSAEHGRTPDQGIVDTARAIGLSVVRQTPILMDDTPDVLRRLRPRFTLILYTAGLYQIQHDRLRRLGIARCFDALYVRERKSVAELETILREHHLRPEHAWMVGNSLRSDINPALRLGLHCIWLHGGAWEYDDEDSPPHGRMWHIERLHQLLPIVQEDRAVQPVMP